MSISKFLGGLITKNPAAPSGPYQNSTAPGMWTLTQVANYIKQGLWPTAGNVNPDAFIENLFSTYLYTGNGSTQTIINGIDLSGKGGLVWFKPRNQAFNHALYDTARGTSGGFGLGLISNSASAQVTGSGNYLTTFNSNGFTTSANGSTSNDNWVAWNFRKQAKFFTFGTYTGNGAANRVITHDLGSAPGCIIVKNMSYTGASWNVYHRSLSANQVIYLNLTNAAGGTTGIRNVTSTSFTLGATDEEQNSSGHQFVYYAFAHDAGGFGLSGTDNVISCGSFTTNGAGSATVNLGYEPQWLMTKATTTTGDWFIGDSMRGLVATASSNARLLANTSGAETTASSVPGQPTSTGFIGLGDASTTYIYIAIRRGPMKTPTSGTSVFAPYNTASISLAASGSRGGAAATDVYSFGFPIDFGIQRNKSATEDWYAGSRLTGDKYLLTNSTAAEATSAGLFWDSNKGGWKYNSLYGLYGFARAPGFFDEVCYTGTGADGRTVNHNLGVSPELIIIKSRTSSPADYGWVVSSSYLTGGITTLGRILFLNTTAAQTQQGWVHTATTTSFKVDAANQVNSSLSTYVALLFASCPGVSKVGSYTGTGTTQQINCGFSAGSRFVLIKRTDSTGDWYVWDSARGIVAGNDPYLLLNSTAAEVTSTDYVDTYSAGFEISSTAPAAINANGGTFIFLAIA